jgi:Co/Zn/Cd efflux system component
VLVLLTTRTILRDIVHTLMERAPAGVNVNDLNERMARMAGIADVHDLHVWSVSADIPILTAHVHLGEGADPGVVLAQIEAYCRGLGIRHSTVQICNPVGGGSSSSLTALDEGHPNHNCSHEHDQHS